MESLLSTRSKPSETVHNFSLFFHFCLNVTWEKWLQISPIDLGLVVQLLSKAADVAFVWVLCLFLLFWSWLGIGRFGDILLYCFLLAWRYSFVFVGDGYDEQKESSK